jgi:hypothetical protein
VTVAATIIRRDQRTLVVPIDDDRPTSAIDPAELRGLIGQTGGLDAEIEIVAVIPPEPPAVIVDVPPRELLRHARPTGAMDPAALRALVNAPMYPVYRGSPRWLLVAALAFALLAVVLVFYP